MPSLREDNLRMAALKVIADAVAEAMTDLRHDHLATLLDRYDDEGTKTFTVKLPDGQKVATVSLAEPAAKTQITDQDAFTTWALSHGSQLVEVVDVPEQVVPAHTEYRLNQRTVAALLKTLTPAGGGAVVDESTGEVVPGVEHTPAGRPKSFSIRYEGEGRAQVVEAYRRGDLSGLLEGTPLALPAAPGGGER